MKKWMGLFTTVILLSAMLCMPAIAEESSPHNFSATVIVGTDYIYRGVSETDNKISWQLSLDYEHRSGFYTGIWAGKIDGDSTYVDDYEEWTYATDSGDVELDFYAGYWTELGPIELDLTVTYMYFPGNADAGLKKDPDYDDWIKGEAETDYWEFHVGLAHTFYSLPTVPRLSVGFDYSPDYWGEDGTEWHVNAILEIGLPFELVLALEAGYQDVEGDKQTGSDSSGFSYGVDGKDGFDYKYYRIGISREFLGINCDLSWWTNTEKDWLKSWKYDVPADDQAVITISYSF